jgi:hypothetical protein
MTGRQLFVFGPFVLLGFLAGALYTMSRRPGLAEKTRRLYAILWVLVLLVGGPLWLFLAATVTR